MHPFIKSVRCPIIIINYKILSTSFILDSTSFKTLVQMNYINIFKEFWIPFHISFTIHFSLFLFALKWKKWRIEKLKIYISEFQGPTVWLRRIFWFKFKPNNNPTVATDCTWTNGELYPWTKLQPGLIF